MIELIWAYWHEEGMLVQAMNAVSLRFQNKRSDRLKDSLKNLNLDPLRPLNHFIWSYIQDEQHRLTLQRRNYEYDHHYGLRLVGKAAESLQPIDSRSKFLAAFHHLLHLCSVYYRDMSNALVTPDPFPLLDGIRELHLLLAEGAANQFGDLPWIARREFLMQQWLLSRPEMRQFLATRPTMPYQQLWMDPVDTIKKMQDWTDVTVTHFHNLAVYGEALLLSIRYFAWSQPQLAPNLAAGWAQYFRTEIQGYIHAYRVATGVDLTNPNSVDSTLPAIHLQNRLIEQRRRAGAA